LSALSGKRIVVTRAAHQADELASLLRAHDAEPVLYPCIAIAPPEDTAKLDSALRDAANGDFDWLVLTSPNTIMMLKQRIDAIGVSLPDSLYIAAIGPGTAKAASALLGLDARLIPETHIAEALAEALVPRSGTPILLPQSEIARPVLAQSLIASGAAVKAVTAYRTMTGNGGADVPAMLARHEIDAITFTSGSTAMNFAVRLMDEGGDLDSCDGVCIAAIGPTTAESVRGIGLRVDVLPEDHTLAGLAAGLEAYYRYPR
jgi:uroporphyrinogen-III synthase